MRFLNAVATIALGLAAAAHGHVQIIDRDISQPVPTSTAAPTSASASQLPGGVYIGVPLAETTAPADVTSSSTDEYSVETSMPTSSAAAVSQPQPTSGGTNFSPLTPSSPFSFSNGTASTNTSTAAGSKCSKEGQYNCQSDGKAYQRCAAGLWSIAMPVALGNPCKPGLADTFVSAQKRSSPGFARRRRFAYEYSRGKRASSRMG
ncbi:hypothetical protein HDV63DRAFT_44172 [Trichoderma sp. SZMC 28014]